MLKISACSVHIKDRLILENISLEIKKGSVHVLMGPNGSGKSSLLYALMGHHQYQMNHGTLIFEDVDITEVGVHKRAQLGIFLSPQQSYEIPGVSFYHFLKEAFCALNPLLDSSIFEERLAYAMRTLHIDESLLKRDLYVGFSGGEKKRCEMAQLLVLQPKLALLDEIDSGLDVDALQYVIKALEAFKIAVPDGALVIVTHYPTLFEKINPTAVSLLCKGKLIKTGGKEIIKEIQKFGYERI